MDGLPILNNRSPAFAATQDLEDVQSVKMYDRMRKAGKNVEFVSLPLADHYYTRQDDRVALLCRFEAMAARILLELGAQARHVSSFERAHPPK